MWRYVIPGYIQIPAGLAAASRLQALGFSVIVLEGHGRPGGRVYTKRLEVSARFKNVIT